MGDRPALKSLIANKHFVPRTATCSTCRYPTGGSTVIWGNACWPAQALIQRISGYMIRLLGQVLPTCRLLSSRQMNSERLWEIAMIVVGVIVVAWIVWRFFF